MGHFQIIYVIFKDYYIIIYQCQKFNTINEKVKIKKVKIKKEDALK